MNPCNLTSTLLDIETLIYELSDGKAASNDINIQDYKWVEDDVYYHKKVPINAHDYIICLIHPVQIGNEYNIIIRDGRTSKQLCHHHVVRKDAKEITDERAFKQADRLLKEIYHIYQSGLSTQKIISDADWTWVGDKYHKILYLGDDKEVNAYLIPETTRSRNNVVIDKDFVFIMEHCIQNPDGNTRTPLHDTSRIVVKTEKQAFQEADNMLLDFIEKEIYGNE